MKAVGESGELPLLYYQVNVSATINLIQVSVISTIPYIHALTISGHLLQSMIKYKCLNLVYSSSATVYGTPETIPIPETSPVQPESVYGRSKGMCEDIIKDVCLAERSFNAVSLRYFKCVLIQGQALQSLTATSSARLAHIPRERWERIQEASQETCCHY